MPMPKHSKASIKAHSAPDRTTYHDGKDYAEACRLVEEARVAFDAPKPVHPLMIDGKDWNRIRVMDHICNELATTSLGIGSILKAGLDGNNLPSYSTVMKWLDEDTSLSEKYARAKEAQAARNKTNGGA